MNIIKCTKCDKENPSEEPICVFCKQPLEDNLLGMKIKVMIDTALTERTRRYKKYIAIYASAGTFVIGLLGYKEWLDLRDIPKDAISNAIDAEFRKLDVVGKLNERIRLVDSTNSEKLKQIEITHDNFKEKFGELRERVRHETETLEGLRKRNEDIVLEFQKDSSNLTALLNSSREIVRGEVKNFNDLTQASQLELKKTRDIIKQDISDFNEKKENAISFVAEYEKRYAAMEPRLKAMAEIIKSEDGVAIFAKLQSDFTSIKMFQSRIQFCYPQDYEAESPLPFSHISYIHKNNSHIAELSSIDGSLTIIRQSDFYTHAERFGLFEMFAMGLEGAPLSHLDGIEKVRLTGKISANQISEIGLEKYLELRKIWINQINKLVEVRLTTIINGYPISVVKCAGDSVEYNKSEDALLENGDSLAMNFVVADDFSDTRQTLSNFFSKPSLR